MSEFGVNICINFIQFSMYIYICTVLISIEYIVHTSIINYMRGCFCTYKKSMAKRILSKKRSKWLRFFRGGSHQQHPSSLDETTKQFDEMLPSTGQLEMKYVLLKGLIATERGIESGG